MRAHNPPPDTDNLTKDNGFEPEVIYLSPEEWLVMYERDAQELLGISAGEFVQRYRAGDFEDHDPDVMFLAVGISMYDAVTAGRS